MIRLLVLLISTAFVCKTAVCYKSARSSSRLRQSKPLCDGRTSFEEQVNDVVAKLVDKIDIASTQTKDFVKEASVSFDFPMNRAAKSVVDGLLEMKDEITKKKFIPQIPTIESAQEIFQSIASSPAPSIPEATEHIVEATAKLFNSLVHNNVFENIYTVPTFLLFTALSVINGVSNEAQIGSPYKEGEPAVYNVNLANNYYNRRPIYVLKRMLQLAQRSGSFSLKLLLDWRLNRMEKYEKIRAREALNLIPGLGPTAIKLAQALSVRTDLISETYALELRELQDKVPPFSSTEAVEMIKRELKTKDLRTLFQDEDVFRKPIASASIGQVYRAKLIGGKEVAVKIQRPNILQEISLDLFIMRTLTPLQVQFSNAAQRRKTSQADIDVSLALVDEWGRGFIQEINYELEARNAINFIEAMERRNLTAVTAPRPILEMSTGKMLLSEWIRGTRLDEDSSSDVTRLCSVAINAYLTMLLDTGVLHCDPHAGNVLRSEDGKLVILDWGMTLNVPKDLQYSLLEFIAHINSEDFDSLPLDFVNLGFSPSSKLDKLKSSGITDGLSFLLRQLSKGGGPTKIRDRVKEEFKSRYGEGLTDDELRLRAREEMIDQMQSQLKKEGVDVNGVQGVLEEMSRRNRELFRLPSWVLYTTRAFSVLEGIGLGLDSDFSILQSCYPYLASRLFNDNSVRSKNALRAMLLNKSNVLSLNKLLEMQSNFQDYESSVASVDKAAGLKVAQDSLRDLVLNDKSVLQDILLESSTSVADSFARDTYQRMRHSDTGKLVHRILDSPSRLIPKSLQFLAVPLLVPSQVLRTIDHLTKLDEEDEATLQTLREAVQLFQNTFDGSSSFNMTQVSSVAPSTQQVRDIVTDPKITSQIPQVLKVSRKFAAQLMKTASIKVSGKKNSAEESDQLVYITGALVSSGLDVASKLLYPGISTKAN